MVARRNSAPKPSAVSRSVVLVYDIQGDREGKGHGFLTKAPLKPRHLQQEPGNDEAGREAGAQMQPFVQHLESSPTVSVRDMVAHLRRLPTACPRDFVSCRERFAPWATMTWSLPPL